MNGLIQPLFMQINNVIMVDSALNRLGIAYVI